MNSLKGRLLIATPRLLDPNFHRTVLLMLEHTDEGAMGIVLNRLTDATVSDLAETILEEPFTWEKPLCLGGPVTGPLLVFHTLADLSDQEVMPGLYHSLDASKVRQLIRRKAEPSLIVANYAGWGPGQLEYEFDEDSWLTCPATTEHVFWDDERDLWDIVVKEVNAKKLSEFLGLRDVPPDPSLN